MIMYKFKKRGNISYLIYITLFFLILFNLNLILNIYIYIYFLI